MKKLYVLIILSVIVGIEHIASASGLSGQSGANPLSAGATALKTGVAALKIGTNVYKVLGHSKDQRLMQKMDKFDTQFKAIGKKLHDRLKEFLEVSGMVHDVGAVSVTKFQEIATDLKKMKHNIELVHVPNTKNPYSDNEKELLNNVTVLYNEVEQLIQNIQFDMNSLDKVYDRFIQDFEQKFEDKVSVKPDIITQKTEWIEVNGEWIKEVKKLDNRTWRRVDSPLTGLNSKEALDELINRIKSSYEECEGRYKHLKNQYNSQYGSYFTQFIQYLTSTTPLAPTTPSTSATPSTSVAPGAREVTTTSPTPIG